MAGVTGLEPAASCVTGRRSNQLSYTPKVFMKYLPLVLLSSPLLMEFDQPPIDLLQDYNLQECKMDGAERLMI